MKTEHLEIFNDFSNRCRWAAKKVMNWYPLDNYRIIVELDDGAIEYDSALQTYRWAKNTDILKVKEVPSNEEEWRKEFSKKLFRYMYIKNIPQDYLSWKTNISLGSISRYVNGDCTPNAYFLSQIIKVLDLTDEEIADLLCI